MKAVLLAPTPPPAGGIAGWTARMLKADLPGGWSLINVDEKAIGEREVFGQAGKRHMLEEARRCRRIWKGLRQALKDPDAAVVHSCIPSVTTSMMREYVCARIAGRRGRKFIVHFRCTVPNTTRGKMGWSMLRRLCGASDLVMVLNEQSRACVEKLCSAPVVTIPNFISGSEMAASHAIRDDIGTVVYVGGLVPNKGVGECLEIAARLKDITFRFVGKGDETFEKKAREMGLDNVVFTGPKDRAGVKKELEDADVFLFMTRFRGEGFSNALCEAMAAGLPCVATDWAANADMLAGTGGAIVKVDDVDGAVKAIESMRPREVREAMSRSNISRVREHYLQDVVIAQYIGAYERALGKAEEH